MPRVSVNNSISFFSVLAFWFVHDHTGFYIIDDRFVVLQGGGTAKTIFVYFDSELVMCIICLRGDERLCYQQEMKPNNGLTFDEI